MKKKSYFQKKIDKYKKYGISCSGPDPECKYSIFVIDEITYIQGCKDALEWVLNVRIPKNKDIKLDGTTIFDMRNTWIKKKDLIEEELEKL